MLWKCCTQYASKFGKLNSGHRTGKGQFSFQSQRRQSQRMFKLQHNCTHLTHSKVLLKILQARLQQYSRGTRNQIANTCWIIEKQESSTKTSISALLTIPKALTVWITTNCGKFLKIWEYQTTWPTSWEIGRQVKKQKLELDMEQQTGSK